MDAVPVSYSCTYPRRVALGRLSYNGRDNAKPGLSPDPPQEAVKPEREVIVKPTVNRVPS